MVNTARPSAPVATLTRCASIFDTSAARRPAVTSWAATVRSGKPNCCCGSSIGAAWAGAAAAGAAETGGAATVAATVAAAVGEVTGAAVGAVTAAAAGAAPVALGARASAAASRSKHASLAAASLRSRQASSCASGSEDLHGAVQARQRIAPYDTHPELRLISRMPLSIPPRPDVILNSTAIGVRSKSASPTARAWPERELTASYSGAIDPAPRY